jgi:hypothetical protein
LHRRRGSAPRYASTHAGHSTLTGERPQEWGENRSQRSGEYEGAELCEAFSAAKTRRVQAESEAYYALKTHHAAEEAVTTALETYDDFYKQLFRAVGYATRCTSS